MGGAEKTGEDSAAAAAAAAVEVGDTVVVSVEESTPLCPRTLLGEGHEVLRWCARSNVVVVVVVSLSWPSQTLLVVVAVVCAGRSDRDDTLLTPIPAMLP